MSFYMNDFTTLLQLYWNNAKQTFIEEETEDKNKSKKPLQAQISNTDFIILTIFLFTTSSQWSLVGSMAYVICHNCVRAHSWT